MGRGVVPESTISKRLNRAMHKFVHGKEDNSGETDILKVLFGDQEAKLNQLLEQAEQAGIQEKKEVIDPRSRQTHLWNHMISFVLMVYIALAPFEWAFQPEKTAGWMVMEILMEMIFFLDLYVQFHTGFIDENDEPVLSKKKSFRNYLTTYFVFDAIGSFPSELIFTIVRLADPTGADMFARHNFGMKLFRAARLVRLRRYLFSFGIEVVSILRLQLYFGLMTHVIACLWYGIAKWEMQGRWGRQVTWFTKNGIYDSDSLPDQYLPSIYAALAMFIGEDIEPQTSIERLFATIVLYIGAVALAIIVGNITVLIQNFDMGKSRYQEKMRAIYENMQHLKLPSNLRQRVMNYYDYTWNRFRGIDIDAFFAGMPDEIPLSGSLHSEISLCLHAQMVENCKLFKAASPGFIYATVLKLNLTIVSPGDFIVHKDEPADELYFIHRGKAGVVSEQGKILVLFERGSYFGEIGIVLDRTRTSTVKALTFCELYALHKDDFQLICEEYPETAALIRHIALMREGQDLNARTKMQIMQGVQFDTDTIFENEMQKINLKKRQNKAAQNSVTTAGPNIPSPGTKESARKKEKQQEKRIKLISQANHRRQTRMSQARLSGKNFKVPKLRLIENVDTSVNMINEEQKLNADEVNEGLTEVDASKTGDSKSGQVTMIEKIDEAPEVSAEAQGQESVSQDSTIIEKSDAISPAEPSTEG
eukprot:g3602.t1